MTVLNDSDKAILQSLTQAIIDGNQEEAEKLTRTAIERNIDPLTVMNKGLIKGIRVVGDKFGAFEVFLTDLVIAAQSMEACLKIIKPILSSKGQEIKSLGKVVIGTVAGDIHDIGKNIVSTLLQVEGFDVHDAGVDVPTDKFIELVRDMNPDILGLSALLTSSVPNQREVVASLRDTGLRKAVKVMVGGAPVTQNWAKEIDADAYGPDAIEAAKIAKSFVKR